jgi:putative phosphoribosyl transferase
MQRIDPTGVRIHGGGTTMQASLIVPEGASGLLIAAETANVGLGLGPALARRLAKSGTGTLLLGLLSPEELAHRPELRFDIEGLAQRLIAAIDWAGLWLPHRARLGLFGTDTAAAGALVASSRRANVVDAVVSASGRPELAIHAFSRLQAPVLLVVGENDEPCRHANELGAPRMPASSCVLHVVAGADRAFSGSGPRDAVIELIAAWLVDKVAFDSGVSGMRRVHDPSNPIATDELSRSRSRK